MSGRHLSGIPCKLLVAENFLLDYRLSRLMISQSYANEFASVGYQMKSEKKVTRRTRMFATFRTISTEF